MQVTVKDLQRKLKAEQKKNRKLQKELDSFESGVKGLLSDDQIACLKNEDTRGNRWGNSTVQKALQLRLSCGLRGYEFVRDCIVPLPSERIVLENVKFAPGVWLTLLLCIL